MYANATLAALCVSVWVAASATAHPVPSENHDRFLLVRLTPAAVVVEYRLEVDETRAGLDLPKSELAKIESRDALHSVFCEYFGNFLAGNLVAQLDGQPLEFRCVDHRYGLHDELNRPLGHLRCQYRMEAPWKPKADAEHKFTFRESNYVDQDFNRLEVRLAAREDVRLQNVVAPDAVLLATKPIDFKPGDADRLRELSSAFRIVLASPLGIYKPTLPPDSADLKSEPEIAAASCKSNPEGPTAEVKSASPGFEAGEDKPNAPVKAPEPVSGDDPPRPAPEPEHSWSLLNLFLDTKQGVGLALLFAAAFGGIHALTPGHGKTLVAAYLVGERGTVWHALLLGLVTTVTHTAAVIIIAAALLFFPNTDRAKVQTMLEFFGGILILSLGFWLLYTRLIGRADHVHLRGGHHHHHPHGHEHHHHHNHDHDHEHYHLPANGEKASVGALLILGVKGGMVPCWDAIAMLAFAISAGRLWLGLPLLLAFSAGLAGVLTGLGVSVVHARNFAGKRFQQGERFRRFFRALPLLSAAAITLIGLYLCYDSLHPR